MEINSILRGDYKNDDIYGRVKKLYELENGGLYHLIIGTRTKAHKTEITDKIYFLLRGIGFVEIDGERSEVRRGDVIMVGRGNVHKFERDMGINDTFELLLYCNSGKGLVDIVKDD